MTPSTPSAPTEDPLKALYRQIADTASHHTPNWPASSDFCQLLDQTAAEEDTNVSSTIAATAAGVCTNKYKAPRFAEHGPFGLVALLTEDHNAAAQPLVRACLECFDWVVRDLVAIAAPTNTQLHIINQPSHPHVCVFLIHEHPSFLKHNKPPHEHQWWRPVDDASMQQLVQDLTPLLLTSAPRQGILLQLDSILLTPDGGMIAGFVDVSKQQQDVYQNMKTECRHAVQQRLGGGELTSRPKNLIHMTLGRILGFGTNLEGLRDNDSKNQQERVQELVRRYNEEILPETVQNIRREHGGGVWRLQDVCLLRNTVWFCDENIFYKTWRLGATEDDDDDDDA